MNALAARAPAFRRFWDLTVILAVTRFKSRYFGNLLGYFWTLAKPMALFGVLYVVFTKFVRFGGTIPHFPAYLIGAIVMFNYFAEATSTAITSLVDQESVIRKVPIPLLAIPLSLSLAAFFNLALNFIAVVVIAIISGVSPMWTWFEVPFLIAILIVFSTAVGTILANLYVPYRDVGAIWEVVAQLAFWATPVVYTISFVPENLQRIMLLNPLAIVMTQFRHAFVDHSAPSAAQAIGGKLWLLAPLLVLLLTVWAAAVIQRRMAPHIAERL